MINWFEKASFKTRILITYIIGLLIIGITGYGYFFFSQLNAMDKQINNQRKLLMREYKDMAKTAVEVASNIITVSQNLALEGKISPQAAKELAIDNINTVKYGRVGYVWCITTDGVLLVDPPKPELIGKNIFKLNKMPYVSLKNVIEQLRLKNGSYIEYKWFYPGIDNRLFLKISYVKVIPSLNWIIGSGFYLKEINDQLNILKEKEEKQLIESFIESLIPGILSSAISLIILYLLIVKMMKSVEDVAKISEKLLEGEASIEMQLPVISRGAIGKLITNTNAYIEHTSRMLKLKELLELADNEEQIFDLIKELLDEFNIENYNIYTNRDGKLIKVISKGVIPCNYSALEYAQKGVVVEKQCNQACTYLCYPIISNKNVVAAVELTLDKTKESMRLKKLLNRYFQSMAHNINIKKLTASLKELSLHDNLTGLYNRRFLEETLQTLTASAKRHSFNIAVAMLDLDDFKKINDTYGHVAGDKVLKAFAEHLKEHFKRGSDLIIRYGGEEFLVLIQDIDDDEVFGLLEGFRKSIEQERIKYNNHTIKITTSIGYAMVPRDTEDIYEAIELADKALYIAKSKGKNMVVRYREEKNG